MRETGESTAGSEPGNTPQGGFNSRSCRSSSRTERETPMTQLNAKHSAACGILVLVAMMAGCEQRQLIEEAERQLDAAEERIREIGEVYAAGYEQQLVRLERAPDCPPNDYYCPDWLEAAEEEAETLGNWMRAYTSEETENLLTQIRRNIRRAETEDLRRFREPAEDATSEWQRLYWFSRNSRILRAGERAGGGWAGNAAMLGTGLLGAIGDIGTTDYGRLSMEVQDARSRVLDSSQRLRKTLEGVRQRAEGSG